MSLLMEDILQSGYQDLSMVGDDSDNEDGDGKAGTPKMSRRQSVVSAKSGGSRPASAVVDQEESAADGKGSSTSPSSSSFLLFCFFFLFPVSSFICFSYPSSTELMGSKLLGNTFKMCDFI